MGIDKVNTILTDLFVSGSIFGLSQSLGDIAHNLKLVSKITVKNQRVVILVHFKSQPVTKVKETAGASVIMRDRINILCKHKVHVSLHRLIMFPESIHIIILQITLPRHDYTHTLPQRTAEASSYWSNGSIGSVGFLDITESREMPAEKFSTVEQIRHRRREDAEVAAPSHALVTLRTVGRNGKDIRQSRPLCIEEKAVQILIAGLIGGGDLVDSTQHKSLDIL